MQQIERSIRDFIADTFPSEHDIQTLPAQQSLFDSGVIDSIAVLTIVVWLEETFDIIVDDDDVVPENIDGIANLTAYVVRKREQAGQSTHAL